MTNNPQPNYINNFFQGFINAAGEVLAKNLDSEIFNKIEFLVKSSTKIKDVESLRKDHALYKIDYATASRQGTLMLVLPEELIANIADTIMGGTGKGSYSGSLSELETNSILKLIEKIFKYIESYFKSLYNQDLVFSVSPLLLLKEMPNYETIPDELSFDFLVSNSLSLNDDNEFEIDFALHLSTLESLMNDLGVSKSCAPPKKQNFSPLSVANLSDIQINITAELGRAQVPIKYAMELSRGSLVELDTQNNSDIKVFANGVEFAYAQLVAVEDNFGLKITRVMSPEERLEHI